MMLTFEKIREIYWKERESQKLQEIPENFFGDSSEYMKGSDEPIKAALNDLIDSRQSKLLKMAFVAAKTGSSKPHNLLREEEPVFYSIVNSLKDFRSNILEGKTPANHPEKSEETRSAPCEAGHVSGTQEKIREGFCMIKESLPSFIGNDMKTYHLKKGDRVYLPSDLMSLLVKNGVCERLN